MNAPKPASKDTSLPALEDAERSNLEMAKGALGALWELGDSIAGLYGELALALLVYEGDQHEDELFGVLVFLLSAERSAKLGLLDVGRLHFQEAAMKVRRALEMVGFCRLVWKDPPKLRLWLLAGDSDAAYKRYQETFSGKPFHACLKELHARLPLDYDRASRMTHSTLASMAQSYRTAGDEIQVHYFDLQQGDATPLVMAAMSAMQTHLDALTGFASLTFKGREWRESRRLWESRRDPCMGAFSAQKQRWRGQIARYRANLGP